MNRAPDAARAHDVVTASFAEIASIALSREAVLEPGALPTPAGEGVRIGISGPGWRVELGFVAQPDDGRQVAAALLGREAASLDDDDVRDALAEIVNMLGGTVKRDLGGGKDGISLELPERTDASPEGPLLTSGRAYVGSAVAAYWMRRTV